MDNIEISVRKFVFLSDGFKYLVFYLRKNGIEFKKIAELIGRLTDDEPHLKTLHKIFSSINNRLRISSTYKDSELIFLVVTQMMNLIIHQLTRLQVKEKCGLFIDIKNIDSPTYPHGFRYVIEAKAKHLNFKMVLLLSYHGKISMTITEMKPSMQAIFDNPMQIIQHLAHLENLLAKSLNGESINAIL